MRFGDFSLDRTAQQLSRRGEPVALDPRAWSVLCCLADRAGNLVTKTELLAAAWPDVAVSDAALSQALQRLRRALGDDARRPRYIETIHRRGFRFIAAIRSKAAAPYVTDGAAAAQPAERRLFVGRAAELRHLAAKLASGRSGTRQVVFIEGEAGMGKSALLHAFLTDHVGPQLRVATSQCIEQKSETEPYMPALEALDRLARADTGIIELLSQHAPTCLAQMPWLVGPDAARRLGDRLADASRQRMLREMARALEIAARVVPLVLVIEDLHWADPATLDLLGALAQRADPARLIVLATYRPAQAIIDGHPVIDLVRTLWARRSCTRLSLELLTAAEVREYLWSRFAAPELVASLGERLYARSDGNPLFLQTIVDHLVERGLLAEDTSGWHLVKALGAEDLQDIPGTLREMIELQLDSVDAAGREVLDAASVAAPRFRAASVGAALGRPSQDGTEAVENTCERLVRRWHLLRAAGEQTWPDGTRTACYEFRLELYRQVLYERLPPSRRRRLHQRIGERIEQAFAADLPRAAADLAAQFDHSGDGARTVTYLLMAARQARRRFAEREADTFLRAALHRLNDLPPGAARDVQELQARMLAEGFDTPDLRPAAGTLRE